MTEDMYWVWISRMRHLDYESFDKLIKKYGNICRLWNLTKEELISNNFCNINILSDFLCNEYKQNLKYFISYMKRYNIKIINCYDKTYPVKLNYIENRPIVLYTIGCLENINNESVAIVGSRLCTKYGVNNAKFFSSELAKRNVNIISGLAKGIDSIAHSSCLESGGKTIAVVGTGLDMIYPQENIGLAYKIIKSGGLIVSEFPMGTKISKENFPRRNRIISGLSNVVIVVEAGEKSGSLITAECAINQGREVFAIPGNITLNNYKGSNLLIKDGANVLTSIDDIIR